VPPSDHLFPRSLGRGWPNRAVVPNSVTQCDRRPMRPGSRVGRALFGMSARVAAYPVTHASPVRALWLFVLRLSVVVLYRGA
jgi:hypothetical protein